MVAITVILAAVIAGVVLDVGQSAGDPPVNAAASIEFDDDDNSVLVTMDARDESSTELNVKVENTDADETKEGTISELGGTAEFDADDIGDTWADGHEVRVTVTAVNGDRESLITQRTDTL